MVIISLVLYGQEEQQQKEQQVDMIMGGLGSIKCGGHGQHPVSTCFGLVW
jgi:hypothetical protein